MLAAGMRFSLMPGVLQQQQGQWPCRRCHPGKLRCRCGALGLTNASQANRLNARVYYGGIGADGYSDKGASLTWLYEF